MKRKLLIPLILATGSVAALPASAQTVPEPSERKAAIDQATQAYLQAEEKVTTIQSVGLSTEPSNRESLRDKLRPLVVESFVARQQLQQTELKELRHRLAEIEQSLAERQKRMDSIVDSRIEELLAGKTGQAVTRVYSRVQGIVTSIGQTHVDAQGKPGARPLKVGDRVRAGQSLVQITTQGWLAKDPDKLRGVVIPVLAPIDGVLVEKNVNVGDVVKRDDTLFQISSAIVGHAAVRFAARFDAGEDSPRTPDEFDLETRERLAQVDLKAAQEEYEAAEQQLQFAQAAFQAARTPHSAVADQEKNLRRAKAEIERAKLRIEGIARQRAEQAAGRRTFDSASASRAESVAADQFEIETRERLAQADVEEAEAIRDGAQHDLDVHIDANEQAPGSTPKSDIRRLQDKVRIAEAQLQRARLRLEGLKGERTGLGAVADAAVLENEAERQKAAAVLAGKVASRDAQLAQVDRAEADLRAAIAKHHSEKNQYEYVRSLAVQKAVSTHEVDQREDLLDAAEAAVAAAKSVVATAKANVAESEAAIEEARADLAVADARLKAAKTHRDRLLHHDQKEVRPSADNGQAKPDAADQGT